MGTRIVIFLCLLNIIVINAQQIQITVSGFNMDFREPCERIEYEKQAKRSFQIVSELYNSKEFQDSIKALKNFACYNVRGNLSNLYCDNDNLNGEEILKELLKKQKDSLFLILKEKHRSSLGMTVPFKTETIAFFNNIMQDMPDLPFAYALAVNIAHEYMHHIGFLHETNNTNEINCYPDKEKHNKDVAYRVGWIAYRILSKNYGKY